MRRVMATATDAERPFYLPGGRLVWAQRTATGFQLQSSDDGRPIPRFLNPTAAPGILPLTYSGTNAFPADVLHDGRILFEAGFRWAMDRRRSCIWSTPTARAWSLCAAIMDARAGAERNWPRGTWCLRTELRWRVLLRRWRMKCRLQRRAASTQGRLQKPLQARGW